MARSNIVLIGMPGSGKSTLGVLLAKALGWNFLDTDVLIQTREGRRLQEILDASGADAFRRVEERHLLDLRLERHVIATGGSAVYSEAAMRHLRETGWLFFLDVPPAELERRLTDLVTRGVVMPRGRTLADLYAERLPLYRRYADVTIACGTGTHERILARLLDAWDGLRAADGHRSDAR